MSLSAMLWVFENSEATLGARLVLLVLADYAHDDGTKAFPDVETISRKARMSRKGVQSALRRLEAEGLIVQNGTRSSGTKIYEILMRPRGEETTPLDPDEGGEETTPLPEEGGEDDALAGAKMTPSRGVVTTPDPPRTQELDPPLLRRVPKTVDGKAVTAEEGRLAAVVLEEWNRQTGQSNSSGDWLLKIVMRIREHPELGADEHAHVIAASLARPWWSGLANPSVVYGNGAQFERSLAAATSAPPPPRAKEGSLRYGRGLTTRQTAEFFGLGEEV